MLKPLIALSAGDPNGIGPEVLLKAAADASVRAVARLVAVGSAATLAAQAARFALGPVVAVSHPAEAAPDGALAVWDVPEAHVESTPGETTAAGGRAAMAAVEAAARLCLGGAVDAMTTAPISKEAIHAAGYRVPGHTEFLESLAGGTAVMVLAADLPGGTLRVALVTVHEPVARVAGVLGRDEIETIAPALAALRAEGIDVTGPFPADAFFGRAQWREADAVVAMYHDQGLAPFKALAQGAGVNVTLGLPLVRTSPDHGTAFGIAGQGVADAASMIAAVRMAAAIALQRRGGA